MENTVFFIGLVSFETADFIHGQATLEHFRDHHAHSFTCSGGSQWGRHLTAHGRFLAGFPRFSEISRDFPHIPGCHGPSGRLFPGMPPPGQSALNVHTGHPMGLISISSPPDPARFLDDHRGRIGIDRDGFPFNLKTEHHRATFIHRAFFMFRHGVHPSITASRRKSA